MSIQINKTDVLYLGEKGEVLCYNHAGVTLQTSIDANPESKTFTGLNGETFHKAPAYLVIMLQLRSRVRPGCESCPPAF